MPLQFGLFTPGMRGAKSCFSRGSQLLPQIRAGHVHGGVECKPLLPRPRQGLPRFVGGKKPTDRKAAAGQKGDVVLLQCPPLQASNAYALWEVMLVGIS